MIAVADPAGRSAHDAYHRFVRDGAWTMSGLWKVLTIHVVARHAPAGTVELLCDDTLFRDAVRSTTKLVVYAMGLNLVVVAIRVRPALGWLPDRTADQRPPPQEKRHHNNRRPRRRDDPRDHPMATRS